MGCELKLTFKNHNIHINFPKGKLVKSEDIWKLSNKTK